MNSDLDYTLTDHAEKDVSSNPASGDIAGCGLCVERSTSDPLAAQSCPVELLELQHLPDESYGADSPSDADEGQREITGALSGTVVDENNVPVYAIDVTLMPVGGTAPADCYHQDPREMGRRNTR